MLYLLIVFFSSTVVFAHGEDKLGPHRGYIQMPHAFHTEVVPQKNGFKVYLLDLEWKNPMVEKSSVKALIKDKGVETKLTCQVVDDYFDCRTDTKIKKHGQLELIVSRGSIREVQLSYQLPLKLKKMEKMNHEMHH